MKAKKITFLNQKGGVGKTTSAVNIGSILASEGSRALLVDLDSQGNLTSAVSADHLLPGSYEALVEGSAAPYIQNTSVENLFCLAGGLDLAGLNIELADKEDRNFYLEKALAGAAEEYDYIFVDCPPDLGILTMNALAWARYVFIPMQCEYFAMEGLNLIMRTIANVRKELNPELEILGIGFMMFSKRSRLNAEVVEDISNYFGPLCFDTKIPRNVRLSEAPSYGLPINVYDNSSAGGKAYRRLAEEVKNRAK